MSSGMRTDVMGRNKAYILMALYLNMMWNYWVIFSYFHRCVIDTSCSLSRLITYQLLSTIVIGYMVLLNICYKTIIIILHRENIFVFYAMAMNLFFDCLFQFYCLFYSWYPALLPLSWIDAIVQPLDGSSALWRAIIAAVVDKVLWLLFVIVNLSPLLLKLIMAIKLGREKIILKEEHEEDVIEESNV